MAETPVLISHQYSKPIKILKWKVTHGSVISIGRVMLLFYFDGTKDVEQRKLKSTQAGTVHRLIAQEGAIVKRGDVLLELIPCIHPTVMNDMCAECGADLRKDDLITIASIPMVHSIPELKVSEELAQKLGKADGDRLLKDRKLVLLVDLDQTIIHTTNDNIPPNIRDVYHFQLYGPGSPWYHTRLRPGTHNFLTNVSSLYELHICTFGARNYAHTITMLIDTDQRYFSNRILSRDECFDSTSKKANLKALFPCGDNMVCIIDDREDVWSHALNLIHVKPYHFFQHTGDINAPPGLDKHENDDNNEGVDLTRSKRVGGGEQTNNVSGDSADGKGGDGENEEEAEAAAAAVTESNNDPEKEDEACENNVDKVPEVVGTNGDESKSQEGESEKLGTNSKEEEEEEESNNKDESNNKEESNNRDESDNKGESDNKEEKVKLEESKKKEEGGGGDYLDIEDPDDYLLYLEDILRKIHAAFYREYDGLESGQVPDLKRVIPAVRGNVLAGCRLVFSGLVPTHVKLTHSKAYQVARSLGAHVTQDLQEDTTHLVAVRPGTAKVNAGRRRRGVKVVTPDWLWTCAERWEHVSEVIYPLNRRGSKNRHPPPHCSSPEHVPDYPVHEAPAARRRTPSGRFMDTINPLMSFSPDDIADMDKEVEDMLDDDESDTEDERKRRSTAAAAEDEATNEEVATAPVLTLRRREPDEEEREQEGEKESSSSEESLTGEYPRGFKRSRFGREAAADGFESSLDEFPSAKFRRGEKLDSDLEIGGESNSDGSVDPPDEIEDGEWNMMGAALEREFLSNN